MGLLLAQGLASEFDAVQVLLDSIHDRVGNGRFSEGLVPVGDPLTEIGYGGRFSPR